MHGANICNSNCFLNLSYHQNPSQHLLHLLSAYWLDGIPDRAVGSHHWFRRQIEGVIPAFHTLGAVKEGERRWSYYFENIPWQLFPTTIITILHTLQLLEIHTNVPNKAWEISPQEFQGFPSWVPMWKIKKSDRDDLLKWISAPTVSANLCPSLLPSWSSLGKALSEILESCYKSV